VNERIGGRRVAQPSIKGRRHILVALVPVGVRELCTERALALAVTEGRTHDQCQLDLVAIASVDGVGEHFEAQCDAVAGSPPA
jgi:hypothetical protein